jgi:lipopolysaccharide/colanic/teichoic acid biosynthesis glycosyltransferase
MAIAQRLTNICLSIALLCVLWPIMILIALAVKLTSKGPIVFRQARLGKGLRPFVIYKFRTMYDRVWDAEHQALLARQFEQSGKVEGWYKKIPRHQLTPIGFFLRSTSLDELPQLFNVLKGEMAIVGPRPPAPYELRYCAEKQVRRLTVPPGLTGLWQVSGRSRLTYDQMIDLDLKYVETRSWLMDLSIILRTPLALFDGD